MSEETRPNGDGTSHFEWKEDYLKVLEQVAETETIETEWNLLRDIIKSRISYNIEQYLSGRGEQTDVEMTPQQLPQSSPMTLPSSSPSMSSSSPIPPGMSGLILPPFPKREPKPNTTARSMKTIMNEDEANDLKEQVLEQLEEFEDHPPFTIQRLCELCLTPRKHYRAVGKYLRALHRAVLVTSTNDMYPPEEIDNSYAGPSSRFSENESLKMTMTPVFSPIPFLHDDARRSRSPSPFELAATRHPSATNRPPHDDSPLKKGGIGLVDELDDPNPGHLADHPKPLSAVTSASLNDRFVKSSSPPVEDADVTMKDSGQAEDAEVEEMVLDDKMGEEEDKEDKPS